MIIKSLVEMTLELILAFVAEYCTCFLAICSLRLMMQIIEI
jgi:hypothetical protein